MRSVLNSGVEKFGKEDLPIIAFAMLEILRTIGITFTGIRS